MTDFPEPPAQHIGDGDDPGRPFRDLMDSGLLWLINSSVFHPRGFALALHVDRTSGEVRGWSLKAAAPGEVYRYAVPGEVGAPDLDALFRAAEATLAVVRGRSLIENENPGHDCGHSCCDERTDPMHDHFLAADQCPACINRTP